ncbi:MAG: hypothetical protein AB7V44_01025 [Pseudonocardia sp.]
MSKTRTPVRVTLASQGAGCSVTSVTQLVQAAGALDDPGWLPVDVLRASWEALRRAQSALAAVQAVGPPDDLLEPAWRRPALAYRLRVDDLCRDDE